MVINTIQWRCFCVPTEWLCMYAGILVSLDPWNFPKPNFKPKIMIRRSSWPWHQHQYFVLTSTSFFFLSTQHFNKVLGQRAVAYLNVDILIEGMDFLRFKSSPLLHTMIYDAAKKVWVWGGGGLWGCVIQYMHYHCSYNSAKAGLDWSSIFESWVFAGYKMH